MLFELFTVNENLILAKKFTTTFDVDGFKNSESIKCIRHLMMKPNLRQFYITGLVTYKLSEGYSRLTDVL